MERALKFIRKHEFAILIIAALLTLIGPFLGLYFLASLFMPVWFIMYFITGFAKDRSVAKINTAQAIREFKKKRRQGIANNN